MHVRFSVCRGMLVVEEGTELQLGTLQGILIHPDTGKIEGCFVRVAGVLRSELLFVSSLDVLRFGARVYVRSSEVLSPIEDRIRLQPLLEEGRTILGQRIRTEGGRTLGRCRDVQFDTKRFVIEWLFPQRFWRWLGPLPASDIVEVRREAVIVRDPVVKVREREEAPLLERLPDVAEA